MSFKNVFLIIIPIWDVVTSSPIPAGWGTECLNVALAALAVFQELLSSLYEYLVRHREAPFERDSKGLNLQHKIKDSVNRGTVRSDNHLRKHCQGNFQRK